MRWFYIVLPIVLLVWVAIRGRQLQRERGHLVNPPQDLFGVWTGDGWRVELEPKKVVVQKPDGSLVPIDAVVKQAYRRGYVLVQSRGILTEKLAFVPIEIDQERRFTRLTFVMQKDVRTLAKAVLSRQR